MSATSVNTARLVRKPLTFKPDPRPVLLLEADVRVAVELIFRTRADGVGRVELRGVKKTG
jgi:hypothetical protein